MYYISDFLLVPAMNEMYEGVLSIFHFSEKVTFGHGVWLCSCLLPGAEGDNYYLVGTLGEVPKIPT